MSYGEYNEAFVPLRATAKPAGVAPRANSKPRKCRVCGIGLSRYNTYATCYVHTPLKPVQHRGQSDVVALRARKGGMMDDPTQGKQMTDEGDGDTLDEEQVTPAPDKRDSHAGAPMPVPKLPAGAEDENIYDDAEEDADGVESS